MANEKILTGVKHIYFYPWKNEGGTESVDIANKLELKNVIADTVAIAQDDPDINTIDCETRDEPIIEAATLGNHTVTMESADIALDILDVCLGYTKVGSTIAYAPSSYKAEYALVYIEMESDAFVLPRIQVTSKIDASSLKTGVAKGIISGSSRSAKVTYGAGQDAATFDTPFFVCPADCKPAAAAAANAFKVERLA